MSEKIAWKTLSEDEQRKNNDLWGETSNLKDPIISRPYNVLMPRFYEPITESIRNFEVRPDDIWIITYPKCGTTWTQEIVWHIINDVNKDLGKLPLYARTPFLEFEGIHSQENSEYALRLFSPETEGKKTAMMKRIFHESVDVTRNHPSPRIIKSHMPLEFLPGNLLDTAKVVYVCRNPKDTCVSYFHFMTKVFDHVYQYKGTFDQYIDLFMNGGLEYGNYFDHLKTAWKCRNHPNMKFIWYEDMRKDSPKEVADLARFVNRPLSEAKIEELVEHLKFSNMKERATQASGKRIGNFFRKVRLEIGRTILQATN